MTDNGAENGAENGATNKKKREYKWKCQWIDCVKYAQPNCNVMCKAHYKQHKLSQPNNDAQQGAADLASFSNVCKEQAICYNVLGLSHQDNINSIGRIDAENNTVKLQCAAEGVVNGHPSISSLSQSLPVQPPAVPVFRTVDDAQIDEESIPLMAYIATLEEKIRVMETQMTISNENLQRQIKALEQKVQNYMNNLALSLPTFSGDQTSKADPLIGCFSTFPVSTDMRQPTHRTARSHEDMLTRCESKPNAGLKNYGRICYSNAVFQALASCNHRTTLFNDPPQQKHEQFKLYYAFTELLHSMANRQFAKQHV